MPVEPIDLTLGLESVPFTIRTDSTLPFVLTGDNEDSVTLTLGTQLTGPVNLQGPQGEPSIRGFSAFCNGTPIGDEPVVVALSPYDVTLSLTECKAEALEAATAQTIFKIYSEGLQIGTVTFAATSTIGIFSFSDLTIAKGELVTIVAPSIPDATLADITFLLAS